MKMVGKRICLVACLLVLTASLWAVDLNKENRDPKYVQTIIDRSQKIVDKLGLKDATVALNVRNIIANRYFALNDIYEVRDAKYKKIKESGITGEAKSTAEQAAQDEKDSKLYRSHFGFTADLSLYLTPEQIVAVKDGLTYGVVGVTYKAQLDMIPTLKEDEKAQILAWLVEAREFAMDAESSGKKHEAFGKYKGRINNYLSKKGYDLKAERKAWAERLAKEGKKL